MAFTFISSGRKDDRVAFRIRKKTRFALELYAASRGESLSEAASNLLDGSLIAKESGLFRKSDEGEDIYLPEACWELLEPDRFVKLGLVAPDLMTDHQKVCWKVIQENKDYWTNDSHPDVAKIRRSWNQIIDAANALMDAHG